MVHGYNQWDTLVLNPFYSMQGVLEVSVCPGQMLGTQSGLHRNTVDETKQRSYCLERNVIYRAH
jgi:hypothetical protein